MFRKINAGYRNQLDPLQTMQYLYLACLDALGKNGRRRAAGASFKQAAQNKWNLTVVWINDKLYLPLIILINGETSIHFNFIHSSQTILDVSTGASVH